MQRLSAGVLLFLVAGIVFMGCGGGSAKGPTVSIVLTPSEVSLTRGAVAQITAEALDVDNNIVSTPDLAYHSSNPSVITVSNTGLICAGQWNALANQCYDCSNPDPSTNQCPASGGIPLPLGVPVNITATATVQDTVVTSSTVVVTDHWPIDSVEVCSVASGTQARTCPAPTGSCVSQTLTAQYAAEAFSKDPVACAAIGSPAPCQIPDGTQGTTNTIGSINWTVSPAQVATADASVHIPQDPVTVTAAAPGQGVVVASIGSGGPTVSGSASFTTCPVASIHVQQQNAPTGTDTLTFFTAPVGATVPLVANVTDTNGVLLPNTGTIGLAWLTSQPALASVSLGSVDTETPGMAEITAVCLPPSCNTNLNRPIFSDDVVTANITGTPDSSVLVATATPPVNTTSSNDVLSIDTTTNSVATTYVLPANVVVNSMVVTPSGTLAFLATSCTAGTTSGPNGAACSGLLRLDPSTTTVAAPVTTITGNVLTTDGSSVVLSDPTNKQVLISTTNPSIVATLNIPNATSAAISPDGGRIYILDGNTLYLYSAGLPLRTIPLTGAGSALATGATPQQVAFFGTDAMAYVAVAGGDDLIAPFIPGSSPANCSDAFQTAIGSGAPTHVAAIPNATGMVDANPNSSPPGIDEIDASNNGQCPPTIANTVTPHSFPGLSSFTPRELLVTDNSQLAVILANEGVLVYNLGTKQTYVVSLAGGATPLSGGLTPDSANLYVGASDGAVHRVDLTVTPPNDAQTIAVNPCPSLTGGCKPDFTMVRPVTAVATLSSLSMSPVNPTTTVGAKIQFTATGSFSDGTTRDMTNFVTWGSTNTVVAIIGPNTTVTPPLVPGQEQALAVGTSTITASSGGVSVSTTLTVQ